MAYTKVTVQSQSFILSGVGCQIHVFNLKFLLSILLKKNKEQNIIKNEKLFDFWSLIYLLGSYKMRSVQLFQLKQISKVIMNVCYWRKLLLFLCLQYLLETGTTDKSFRLILDRDRILHSIFCVLFCFHLGLVFLTAMLFMLMNFQFTQYVVNLLFHEAKSITDNAWVINKTFLTRDCQKKKVFFIHRRLVITIDVTVSFLIIF